MAASATSTLSRLGRATFGCVARLAPCRLARRVSTMILHRGRTRAVADVEWFDDVEADELAG